MLKKVDTLPRFDEKEERKNTKKRLKTIYLLGGIYMVFFPVRFEGQSR